MGPLGTLFSAIDTTKRKLGDLFSSPVQSAQQMVGYANDRARGLNELTRASSEEFTHGLLSGSNTDGPHTQKLIQTLADSYNPMGMTSIGPRSEALETARKNAVKMLGLPENNTAMDRAKALGFDADVYHSSLADVVGFKPHGKFAGYQGVSGVSVTDSPEMASRYLDRYADYGWVDGVPNQPFKKNVMPLMMRKGNTLEADVSPYKPMGGSLGAPLPENYQNPMIRDGIDTLIIPDAISRRGAVKHSDAKNAIKGNELIAASPAQLRSRFAAFDPARVNENDLLGRADPRLLGLLGIGAAGGVGAYNYFKDK